MRNKAIFGNARMLYFAANKESVQGAVKLEEQPEAEKSELKEVEKPKEEGTRGEKPVTEAEKLFKEEDAAFTIELAEEAKHAEKPEGDALKAFIEEESKVFKAIGDSLKDNNKKAAERWAKWAPIVQMKLGTNGKLDLVSFLNSVWDLLSPEVKIPVDGKPGKFYKWGTAAKWNCSAAKAMEAMRSWLRNHADRLYPELLPAKVEVVGEDKARYASAKRALDTIHKLTFLPPTKYVELDENGTPKEGAKPVTLDDLLMSFYKEAVEPHIEQPKTTAEKVKEATAEQLKEEELTAEELKARIEELQSKLSAKKAA